MDPITNDAVRKRLTELFSGYRAEWLNEQIFDLFTEPSYFPQLTASHPCFLEGGRGTGKTTALRSLSYQGQAALRYSDSGRSDKWDYYGMYYRINTNRVRAFSGDEVTESQWIRMFGHYLNLEFCELLIQFLKWYGKHHSTAIALDARALDPIATALGIGQVGGIEDFHDNLRISKLTFESTINNVASTFPLPLLSMQGVPVDLLVAELKSTPQFADTSFFFLIDEYENLADYQQRVLNTLIKHCGDLYSFKVGVRELGFREKSTLNEFEVLTHPADFKLINISHELSVDNRFSRFAADVCSQRLAEVFGGGDKAPHLTKLLPEMSPEDEAELLGVVEAVKDTVDDLKRDPVNRSRFQSWLSSAHPLELFALSERAKVEQVPASDKLIEVLDDPKTWAVHYDNYKYSYLFSIRRGKRGIRKYFAGWRVFCSLAGANIRYLLELVDQAIDRHLKGGNDPQGVISVKIQTEVAQITGQRNLRQLEGLSLNGAKLTRLLLGLGRVFQVMAEDPFGHTPEVNHFHLASASPGSAISQTVAPILHEAIMHLALQRYPASKLQAQTNIRDFDYATHPIFSPFFGFSHRRKRKIEITDQEILDLIERPNVAISSILTRQNRRTNVDLPEQMVLFEGYYGNDQ